jgi:hypothetical protein
VRVGGAFLVCAVALAWVLCLPATQSRAVADSRLHDFNRSDAPNAEALGPGPPTITGTTSFTAAVQARTQAVGGNRPWFVSWYLEYAPTVACNGSGAQRTSPAPLSPSIESTTVATTLHNLQAGQPYAVCLDENDPYGSVVGQPAFFVTRGAEHQVGQAARIVVPVKERGCTATVHSTAPVAGPDGGEASLAVAQVVRKTVSVGPAKLTVRLDATGRRALAERGALDLTAQMILRCALGRKTTLTRELILTLHRSKHPPSTVPLEPLGGTGKPL